MKDVVDPAAAPDRPTGLGTSAPTDVPEAPADPHADVGGYVVGALDPSELAEFSAHLEFCGKCRREVRQFREATAELAWLVPAQPPTANRGSTLAAIHAVSPLPPEPPTPGPAGADDVPPLDEHPSIMPWSLELGRTATAIPTAAPLAAPTATPAQTRPRGVPRVLFALTAAALALALALGGWLAVSAAERGAEVTALQVEAEQQTRLLVAPDARVLTSTLDGAPISYVVSRQLNRAQFVSDQLSVPPAGRVYQIWVVTDGNPASAGLVRTGGRVRTWLSTDVADAEQIAVTIEPGPDGSPAPTQQPASRISI